MSLFSPLFVVFAASRQPAPLQLQCRPSGGMMSNLVLLEIDVDQSASAFKSRRFFKSKEGEPVVLDGRATVTDASIVLVSRTPPTDKFEHEIRIDRTSGSYSMTMALDENPTRPNLSTGVCSRSQGKAF